MLASTVHFGGMIISINTCSQLMYLSVCLYMCTLCYNTIFLEYVVWNGKTRFKAKELLNALSV